MEVCESVEIVGGSQPSDGSTNVDGTIEEASGISSLPSGQGFKIRWKKRKMMEQDGHAGLRDFFALMNVKQSVIHLPKIGDCIKKNTVTDQWTIRDGKSTEIKLAESRKRCTLGGRGASLREEK